MGCSMDIQVSMLGLNISCISKLSVVLVWSVKIKELYIGWVGCLGDEERGFLYYNLQLTFIPFLCSFYLH